MNSEYPKTLTAAFIGGFVLFYLGTLWLVVTIFAELVTSSWSLLGAYAWKLKIVSLVTPIFGAVAGVFTASVMTAAREARGADRMNRWQFFKIGWLSMVIANVCVLTLGLRIFVARTPGEQWLEHVGQFNYNGCVCLLAPTMGYIGAIVAVVVTQLIIKAQKT